LTALFSLLQEPGFDRSQIESIELLRSTEPTDSATFRSDPRSGLEAKFSVPFVMAAACLDGNIDINTFREDNFERIYRSDCMQKTHIVVDRSLAARGESGRVTVHLENGSQRHYPLGRGLALRGAGVVDKFLHNVQPLLGGSAAAEIADRVMHLERQGSTRALIGTFARAQTPNNSGRMSAQTG
jgi:2-methylcitrate dehydratase PrpD